MPRIFFSGMLLVAASTMIGCHGSQSSDLQSAVDLYDQDSITLAKRQAQSVFQQGGTEAAEAAWIIGLCDYRHGRYVAARSAFELAAASPDLELSSRSKAMVGQVLLEEGQPAAAAVQFEHAWPDLTGDDRARCARHAATAWAQAGRSDLSAQWDQRSSLPASPITVQANQPLKSTPPAQEGAFTLQAGAYKNPNGARRAQQQLSNAATRAGLGTSAIRTRTDRHGGKLYLVQVGGFQTRQQAVVASRAFPEHEMIIVTVKPSG